MIRTAPSWSKYIYISPDEVVKDSKYSAIADEEQRYRTAMTDCKDIRNQIISLGFDLVFETVFSTPEKMDFLLMAKSAGYDINVIFVSTENPQINIQRVANRVLQGGHDVPPEKVISRYDRCMEYLYSIFEIADYMSVYDNSGEISFPIFYKEKSDCYYLNEELSVLWLDRYFRSVVGKDQEVHKWYSLSQEKTLQFVNEPNSRKIGLMTMEQ